MTDNKLEIILAAKDITGRAFDRVKNEITGLSKNVFNLNTAVAGLAGAGGFGLLVQQSMAATSEMKKSAEIAGLSISAYQELSYASGQYSVTQDALTDGLKELNLRAEEFAFTGKGPGAEAFERLGYTGEELNRKLKDTPGLMLEIIDRMQGMEKAAQMRLADEIFGGQGGEQFVSMINAGSAAIRQFTDEARKTGRVLDDDTAAAIIKADKTIQSLSRQIQTQFSVVVGELAPTLEDVAQETSDWIGQNKELIRQNMPGYIGKAKDAASDALGVMKEIKVFYDDLPDGIKGDLGVGLIGGILLGPKGGLLVGGSSFLIGEIKDFVEGLEGLKAGHITTGEFFGDESEFEAALARFRELKKLAGGELESVAEIDAAIKLTKDKLLKVSSAGFSSVYADDIQREIEEVQTLKKRLSELQAMREQVLSRKQVFAEDSWEMPDFGSAAPPPKPTLSKDEQEFWVKSRIQAIKDEEAARSEYHHEYIQWMNAEIAKEKDLYDAKLSARNAIEIQNAMPDSYTDYGSLTDGLPGEAEYEKSIALLDEFNASFEQMNMNRFEIEREQIEKQAELYEKAGVDKVRLEEWVANKTKAISKAENEQRLSDIHSTVGTMTDGFKMISEMGGKHSEEAFKMYKAFKITETLISTYSGAMKAYEALAWFPPAAVAAAAAVTGFGMAQVAMISDAEPPSYDVGGISSARGVYQTGDILEAHVPIPSGKIPVEINGGQSGGGGGQTFQVIMQNPVFQDMETQRKSMANIAEIVAARVAPRAVIQNYQDDGPIRDMVRRGA